LLLYNSIWWQAVGGTNSKYLNDVSRRLTPHKGGVELVRLVIYAK
jgi:hypothetical protein